MIHFEIVEGPDASVVQPFKFFQNQIYIGKKTGNLVIQDGELKATHIMIEVVGQDLLIHPQRDVEFYLLNGKRATTIRKLKPSDEITIGKTTLKVISFEETLTSSRKSLLTQKMNQLLEENSPKLPVIEKLSALSK